MHVLQLRMSKLCEVMKLKRNEVGFTIQPIPVPWDERCIYLHLVNIFYGFHLGKYTLRPMGLLWASMGCIDFGLLQSTPHLGSHR